MKKITKATFKSFIRKNIDYLYINVKTEFDGMVDGCEPRHGGFKPIQLSPAVAHEHSLFIGGLYLVNGGDDRFYHYEDENFMGIEYCNCCGRGILAIAKAS